MFKWLKRLKPGQSPKYGGEIEYYGLSEWWAAEFTDAERDEIAQVYRPMGSDPLWRLDKGEMYRSSHNRLQFLGCIVPWLTASKMYAIQDRFILKIETEIPNCRKAFESHIALMGLMQAAYTRRREPNRLSEAERYCRAMIELSDAAAKELRQEQRKRGETVEWLEASHPGYKQLCIILDKRGDWAEAIQLCDSAEAQGWKGDWPRRKARLSKKLHAKKKP